MIRNIRDGSFNVFTMCDTEWVDRRSCCLCINYGVSLIRWSFGRKGGNREEEIDKETEREERWLVCNFRVRLPRWADKWMQHQIETKKEGTNERKKEINALSLSFSSWLFLNKPFCGIEREHEKHVVYVPFHFVPLYVIVCVCVWWHCDLGGCINICVYIYCWRATEQSISKGNSSLEISDLLDGKQKRNLLIWFQFVSLVSFQIIHKL